MNEIIEAEISIRNLEQEEALFNRFVEARKNFKDGVSKFSKGDITRDDVEALFKEKESAFSDYAAHMNNRAKQPIISV